MIRFVSFHTILFVALLALMALPLMLTERSASAQAARNADAIANKRVTLDLRDVSMADALTACCKQAGCTYRCSEAIKGFVACERRTLHVQSVPFKTVFESLLAPGCVFTRSYSYHQVGSMFLIEGPKVYTDTEHAKPAEILTAILDDVGVSYVFPSEALDGVPMDFVVSNMPLEQALKLFLACIHSPPPFRYVATTGIFVFFNDATGQPIPPILKDVDPALNSREGNVVIKFKNVERLEAIRALFQVYQKNYSINVPMSSKLTMEQELPFRTGLEIILRDENPRLTYKIENDVYTICKTQFRDALE